LAELENRSVMGTMESINYRKKKKGDEKGRNSRETEHLLEKKDEKPSISFIFLEGGGEVYRLLKMEGNGEGLTAPLIRKGRE